MARYLIKLEVWVEVPNMDRDHDHHVAHEVLTKPWQDHPHIQEQHWTVLDSEGVDDDEEPAPTE